MAAVLASLLSALTGRPVEAEWYVTADDRRIGYAALTRSPTPAFSGSWRAASRSISWYLT